MPAGLVRQTTLRLLAADLGPESPLPPFNGLQKLPDPSSAPDLPPDMRERIAYGQLANPLPYALQNSYRRDLGPQEISAIQLTNGRLEALVLPSLGAGSGRCASSWPTGIWCSPTAACSSPTSPSPTPGSPAASSGTSAPPATRPRRADQSSRAACRPPAEPPCGSGNGNAPGI
jgi:hypothetical protein